jgi:hypothetical protein
MHVLLHNKKSFIREIVCWKEELLLKQNSILHIKKATQSTKQVRSTG